MAEAKVRSQTFRYLRAGFTLVELIVVMAIVAILVGLLLPAISTTREAARATSCKNNLHNIALGALVYTDVNGTFPHGGWGQSWVGSVEQGVGQGQPGGWAYVVLPYLEQSELYRLERSANAHNSPDLIAKRLSTPLSIFVCPSRRACQPWATADVFATSPSVVRPHLRQPKMSSPVTNVARSDYAINSGTHSIFGYMGPTSLEEVQSSAHAWPPRFPFDGVSHLRRAASLRSIVDGFSNSYLVGEKFLDPKHYYDGLALGDNETLYSGYCSDLHRFTRIDLTPLRDYSPDDSDVIEWRFGSAHPGAFHMAMCDGSLKSIDYEIDALVYQEMGSVRPVEIPPPPKRPRF